MATRDADLLERVIVAELPRWIAAHPQLRVQLRDALIFPDASPQVMNHTMAYEEFLTWADEDTLAEWVDGEVVMTSPASAKHQLLADFLLTILRTYVEANDLGLVLSAPFQMKLERSGREPDLLFLATAHLDRLKETHLEGPADLVVEIVSDESVERDRGAKFYEYMRAGVPEYWLIDPQTKWAEFYHLIAGDRYRAAFSGEVGKYHSAALLGFWLRVEWLWQTPLPATEDVLLEVGKETYARRWIERLQREGFLSS